jgi:hypothetical protein
VARSTDYPACEVGDWNLFFATSAGSAATLVGLLFVASQLHVDVFTDERNRWAALAQSTLTTLSVCFVVSLFFLVPQIPVQFRGEITGIVIGIALYRAFRIWWPVVRVGEKGRRHRLAQSFWLLVVPIIGYAYVLFAAVQLMLGHTDALLTLAGSFLVLFFIALRNAWRLVVSVGREATTDHG